MIAGVLYIINEVKLSIYRFLNSGAKNSLDQSSWGSIGSLAVGAFNALVGYYYLDRKSTGPQPGRGEPQLGRGSYYMREIVFGTPRSNLNRTRATD